MSAILVEQNAQKVLGVTDRAAIIERGCMVHEAASADLAGRSRGAGELSRRDSGGPAARRQGAALDLGIRGGRVSGVRSAWLASGCIAGSGHHRCCAVARACARPPAPVCPGRRNQPSAAPDARCRHHHSWPVDCRSRRSRFAQRTFCLDGAAAGHHLRRCLWAKPQSALLGSDGAILLRSRRRDPAVASERSPADVDSPSYPVYMVHGTSFDRGGSKSRRIRMSCPMPIQEADPWRMQYFEGAACPTGVNIPTDDEHAWTWYPRHRWIYDKVAVALSQGLEAAPHGVPPSRFPVFSKPIVNLRGMGAGSQVIRSMEEYLGQLAPGHMWMTLLEGRHVSSDVAIVAGRPRWWRHVTGRPGPGGTFDYWTIHAESDPEIEAYCAEWIGRNMSDYTGMLNFETINGRIIELRSAIQRSMAGLVWARLDRRVDTAVPSGHVGFFRR